MYGRDSQLNKLHAIQHDVTKPTHVRRAADKARQKIVAQMRDKKLMGMRSRLMAASRAGDVVEMARITALIKDYEGEDRESGHYGV
jgi:hypothetical protein